MPYFQLSTSRGAKEEYPLWHPWKNYASGMAPSIWKPFQDGSPVKVITASSPSSARMAPDARASISKSPAYTLIGAIQPTRSVM